MYLPNIGGYSKLVLLVWIWLELLTHFVKNKKNFSHSKFRKKILLYFEVSQILDYCFYDPSRWLYIIKCVDAGDIYVHTYLHHTCTQACPFCMNRGVVLGGVLFFPLISFYDKTKCRNQPYTFIQRVHLYTFKTVLSRWS